MIADFLGSVLTPLVRGGQVQVGEPIDADDLAALRATDGVTQTALEQARRLVAAEITLAPPPLPLDDEALALGVALYDVLYLTHPAARRHSPRAREKVAQFALRCARLGPPPGREALLARHTMLHNLFRITRTDRRVTFWAGHRDYQGQEPPRRLLRWGTVRRVRVAQVRLNWFREAGVPAPARVVVRALLEASPLTDLLGADRMDPPVGLAAALPLLADPEIARFVAYGYLQKGLGNFAGPLGAALGELSGDAARLALAFVCHLHVLETLAGETVPAWMEGDPPDSVRAFCAAFAAAFAARYLPPGIDAALEERLARRAAACEKFAGPARIEMLRDVAAPRDTIQTL